MTGYKKINMETWARREHYEYYTKQLKVEYNITANVDVKNVLDFCHSKGYIMMTILFLIAGQIFPKILIHFIRIS